MNFRERFARSLKIVSVVMLAGFVLIAILVINVSSNKSASTTPSAEVTKVGASDSVYRKYSGASYVTERFVGDGATKIFFLKRSYDDVEIRKDGSPTTLGMYGSCGTVEACYDYGGKRIIFIDPPAKGVVVTFTGAAL